MANKNFLKSLTPNILQIVILLISVVAAFYIGKLSTEVKMYKEGLQPGNAVNPTGQAAQPQPDAQPYQPIDSSTFTYPSQDDHTRGDPNGSIAIVEYSDFDCPFCSSFHETAKKVLENYDGEVFWVYRHFPLVQLHPDALNKAIASECIYDQGGDEAFWSYADDIFATGQGVPLTDAILQKMATDLGINGSQLISCFNNKETQAAVDADEQDGNKVGVMGTPGNYIVNLETDTIIPLRGAEPYENVVNVIGMVQDN